MQGANASQLEKEIGSDQFPANEHYFGLVNVSEISRKLYSIEYIRDNTNKNSFLNFMMYWKKKIDILWLTCFFI